MRRWLILALLFVLPLQFAWSAAAAYCAHEEAPARAHVGHHVHEHKSSAADKAGKLVADTDCGYCQLSLAKPLLPLAPQFGVPLRAVPDAATGPNFGSRGPDHPDRPNLCLA